MAEELPGEGVWPDCESAGPDCEGLRGDSVGCVGLGMDWIVDVAAS